MPIGIYKRTKKAIENLSKSHKGLIPWNKGKKIPYNPHPKMRGHIPWNKGLKGVMTAWNKGLKGYNSGDKNPFYGKKHTMVTREKIIIAGTGRKQSMKTILKRVTKFRGKNHWNWKGGISKDIEKIRHSIESSLWKQSVFARDGYTCQKYGIKGGKLIAHHILNFSSHPELRFALDNGITFSKKAHDEFHKLYGRKNNTQEQLIEFLNN